MIANRSLPALAAVLFLLPAFARTRAATVNWDGGGDGVHWNDPKNWAGDVLPGAADNAVLGGGPEVVADATDVRVASIVASRSLRVTGIRLATTAGIDARAGTLALDGAHLSGPVTVANAGLALANAPSSDAPVVLLGSTALDGEVPAGFSVIVRGSSRAGHARAAWNSGWSLRGTLRLDSVDGGWSSTLSGVGAPVVAAAGSALASDPGAGGQRLFDGDWETRGTVSFNAGTRVAKTGGAQWTLAGGSVEVAAGTLAYLDSGSLVFSGGHVSGPLWASNSRVEATAGVVDASTVFLGARCTLVANRSPSVTFVVQGGSTFNHAVLGIAPGAVNQGVLRLQSRDGGWTSAIDTGTETLSNGPTGTVVSSRGSAGDRYFAGSLRNSGALASDADSFLRFSGAYEGAGGRVDGPVQFVSTQFVLGPALLGAHTLLVDGTANTLASDIPPLYTLWVRGGGNGHAALRAAQSVSVHGVLHLESVGGGWSSGFELSRTNRDVLSIASDGRLEAAKGAAGDRHVYGDLRNEGVIAVESGIVLDLARTDGIRFVQAGGSATAGDGGRLQVRGGTVSFDGGALSGGVYATQCRIGVGPGALASTLFAAQGCTLANNLSPAVTVRVEGNGTYGHSELVVLPGAVNAGRIHCESRDGGWTSSVSTDTGATLRIDPTGSLVAATGSGGQRRFSGAIDNAGLVAGLGGQTIDFVGTYRGTGGAIGANVRFFNEVVDLPVAPAPGSTMELSGGNSTLVSDIPAGAVVVVPGGAYGGHARLNVPAGFVNRGTLRLVSRDGGWTAGLAAPAGSTLVNAPGGILDLPAGTGGGRYLVNALDNQGALSVAADADFQGGLSNAPGAAVAAGAGTWDLHGTVFRNAGLLELGQNSGTLRLAGALVQPSTGILRLHGDAAGMGRLNVDLAATLGGRLEFARTGAAPAPGTRFTVLAAQSRAAQFATTTGLAIDASNAFNAEYTAAGLDLVATARDPALVGPLLAREPADRYAYAGEPVVFSVDATGSAPLAYQWYREAAAVAGATGATLDLGAFSPDKQGNYSVVVSNAAGLVRSRAARLNALAGSIPLAASARSTPPSVDGDGVSIEVFNGIGGGRPPGPDQLAGIAPSGTTLSPRIDFPRPGAIINVGDQFDRFFADTVTPPAAVRGLAAGNFILRHRFFLRVDRALDLDPTTPGIEVNLGVGSDDGFQLEVAGTVLGQAGDRGFTYTWMPVRFENEGLYPVTLLYAANAVGQSGLEFSWITAARGTEIVPQSNLYTSPELGDRLVTFDDLPAGTVVADQYRALGVRFSTTPGIRVTSDRPDRFVPVSSPNVLGDPTATGAPSGTAEMRFVVPGTDATATTGFVAFNVVDAEATGAVVDAFDVDGASLFHREFHGGAGTRERVVIQAAGIHSVRVQLGGGDDTAAIDQVNFDNPREFDRPPVVPAIADKSVDEGATLSFEVSATDPDPGTVLSYALVAPVPAGATIDAATGRFAWTPDEAQGPADYDVTVEVRDNALTPQAARATFRVRVAEVNRAPVFQPVTVRLVVPGEVASLQLQAFDADFPPQALVFSGVSGPAGLSVSPAGLVTWPVPADAAGDYAVQAGVSDGAGGTASMGFVFRVPPPQPDLVVTRLAVPARADTESPYTVTLRETNQGRGAARGPWVTRLWLSRDALLDASDVLLGTYPFAGTLQPGLFIERTVQFRAPLEPGDYHLIATTDADNAVVESSESNNTSSAGPLAVSAAYSAVVSADFESGVAGTPVPLHGTATASGGGPAASVLVNVHVFVRGTHRVVSALTDGSGRFAFNLVPLPGEAGDFGIGAAHPGAATAPVQDTFRLLGLRAEPPRDAFAMPALSRVERPVVLVNAGQAPLTGLALEVDGAPPGLAVSAVLPARLEGDARATVNVAFASSVDADLAAAVRLRFRTAEGPLATVPVDVRVAALAARLSVDGPAPRIGVLRGGQAVAAFTLRNDGARSTGPLSVSPPPVPWIGAVEHQPLPPLGPGESRVVTLQIRPPSDAALGRQEAAVAFGDGTATALAPFTLAILSSAAAELRVEAVDEYTYYATGSPRVAGARVVVRNADTGASAAEGTTGPDGRAVFPGLAEGWYNVEVSADAHGPARVSALLAAPGPNEVQAFLPREAVKYFFGVEEVTFEERTRVTIETVFETAVPMPVVTLEPNLIDLDAITSDRTEFEVTVTNHGLIAAQSLQLQFGSSEGWRFTTVQTDFGDLPARSSVTVPVVLERVGPHGTASRVARPASTGGCPTFGAVYELVCGNRTNRYSVPGGTAGCGGPGGGGIVFVGSAPGGGGYFRPGTYQSSPIPCDPCLAPVAEALASCALNFVPLGPILGPLKDAYGCASSPSLLSCASALVSAAEAAGKEIPGLGTLLSILDCLNSLDEASKKCAANPGGGPGGGGGGGSGGGGGTPGGSRRVAHPANTIDPVVPGLDPVRAQIARLGALAGPFQFVLGDPAFVVPGQSAKAEAFFQAFVAAQAAASDAGRRISPAETTALLAATRPDGVTDAMVRRAAERWNRTLDYQARGIVRTGDVPAGESTDFLANDLYAPVAKAAADALAADESEGIADPVAAAKASVDHLRATLASAASGGSVCARVRIRLDQDVVQARQGFKATLELDNNGTAPLTGIRVDLSVVDDAGTPGTARFAILAPELSGLTGVDGTGTLGAGTNGKASWMLVPGLDAAPTAASARYHVGGTLRYEQDGVVVSIPLAAVAINVLPIPQLTLQYFHERDVRSDDPFTAAVEPSVPYSLAVLVANHGAGTARQLRITSSQPQIVENEKGLLIDFRLIATEVEGANLVPGLTADFGDVPPGENRVGRWLFTSTLQGQFIAYSATFEHLGPLSGHPEAASVKDASIHEMIHIVRATGPDDDGRPDFLVNDEPDENFLPDTLYRSDGSTNHVNVVLSAAAGPVPTPDRRTTTLAVTAPAGWAYVRVHDPSDGALPLRRVLRPDGTELPLGDDAWTTDRTFVAGGRRPVYEHNLHLFDRFPGGTVQFTLVYDTPPAPDLSAPTSRVAALPASSRAQFAVAWDGSDAGSGIASFDILVSTDGGPFAPWLPGTTARGALYSGLAGHRYGFVSVATDAAGNREAQRTTADATTFTDRGNAAPVFGANLSATVDEGATASVDARAIDGDTPPDRVTYRLDSDAPAGVRIDAATGLVTWPTGEGTGPATATFHVIATDDGFPSATATAAVTITVRESNQPPVVTAPADQVVAERRLLALVVDAVDLDLPVQPLSFSLVGVVPRGATIDAATGRFAWTPDPTQGPSTNRITVRVSDGVASTDASFTVVVRDTEADFAMDLGRAEVVAGTGGTVPLGLHSALDLASIRVRLVLGHEGLRDLTFAGAAGVGSSSLVPAGDLEYELELLPPAGGSLRFDGTAGQLGFGTASGAASAFVRLELRDAAGTLGTEVLDRARLTAGRVVVVGERPLVEAVLDPDRGAFLHARPGLRYVVERSEAFDGSAPWREVQSLVPAGLGTRIAFPPDAGDVFFLRARQAP